MSLYNKREIEEFKIILSEAIYLLENKDKMRFSNNFPPEVAAVLGGVAGGALGTTGIFFAFAGMSGSEIMAALASFGFAGAVGGIASVAALVVAPIIILGSGAYLATNQSKLKREIIKMVRKSFELENFLEIDSRTNVSNLLEGMKIYRTRIFQNHPDVKKHFR